MATSDLAAWDLGSGPSCSDASSVDACPIQCFFCIDSNFCADDWRTCQGAAPTDDGWLSTVLSLTAVVLCVAAVALMCSRGWDGAREAIALQEEPYIDGDAADLGASWGGDGRYAACGGLERSVELGGCRGGSAGWNADAFSGGSNRRLPEGQRLLAWS